jgi:hypothetical protein
MPPVPTTYTNPTGKRALMFSFNSWLAANVPSAGASDFSYGFLQQLNPSVMPRVEVNEFRFFDPGESAFGGQIFPGGVGAQQTQGKKNHAMLDINIFTDQSKQGDGKQKLYTIRDRIVYGLVNAGVPDHKASTPQVPVVLVPPIQILDPANANFDTGITAHILTEEDNHLIENYFPPTAERPLIHQYQILAKIGWYEMRA